MVDPVRDSHRPRLVRLLQAHEPEKIILCGSRARADADEWSDYGVVVIKPTGKPFLQRLGNMGLYRVEFERPAETFLQSLRGAGYQNQKPTSGAATPRAGSVDRPRWIT